MNAKEYLRQIGDCKYQIECDMQRLDELREFATATGSKELKADIVQTSIKNAGLEEIVGKIVDCEVAIRDEIGAYLKLQEFIISQIRGLEADNQYIELLLRRYVHGERFEVIAVGMGYSYERIRHMHGEALEVFGNQYKESICVTDRRRSMQMIFCEN